MNNEYQITEEDNLYRRFPLSDEPKYSVFWKIENGQKIPSSAAFKTKKEEDGLSVDIEKLTTPEKSCGNTNEYGLVSFSAEVPLEKDFPCVHDPKEDNEAHALIVGDTNKIAKKLSKASKRIL
jgi:hypothetical protein